MKKANCALELENDSFKLICNNQGACDFRESEIGLWMCKYRDENIRCNSLEAQKEFITRVARYANARLCELAHKDADERIV